jgi:hypothetical protein
VLRAADVDVELIGAEILEVLAEAEAKASLAGPRRGQPARQPPGRRPVSWPILARPGRFTPEVT